MKHIILCAVASALLVGCATAPQSFGPADGSDYGYQNTKIQSDRFRINYTSGDVHQSRDFALLRAAQIATNEGYSHFRVVSGGTSDNGPSSGISTGIGLGFGGGRRSYNRSSISIGVHDVARAFSGRKVTETIEVILLSNPQSEDPNVYSAQGVLSSIVPPNSYSAEGEATNAAP